MSATKEELLELFKVDENGVITSSLHSRTGNAFVGQPLYAAWYWLNYDEVIDEDDEDESGDVTLLFRVQSEDIEEFPELKDSVGATLTIKRAVRYKIAEVKESTSYRSS